MAKLTKRVQIIHNKIDPTKQYDAIGAIVKLKTLPSAKFIESIDVAINLGINSRKSDQTIRGAVVLPHGTGKKTALRIAVFTQGDNTEAARVAGANAVGMDDLARQVKSGNFDFDIIIASPDAMSIVSSLGQILGPRGLMPNLKNGTITSNITQAVKNAKAGQVHYRNDKNGIIHATIGKINFQTDKLIENLEVLLSSLKKNKPTQSKGVYIKKISLSTTMGIGITINQNSLSTTMVD